MMQSSSRRFVEEAGLIAFTVEAKSKNCPSNRDHLDGPKTRRTSRLSPDFIVRFLKEFFPDADI